MNARSAGYWTTTGLTAFVFLTGGATYLSRAEVPVRGMAELGYPAYFVTILGAWKVLGGLAILAPRLPRLKERAHAGIAFDLTGAAFSQAAIGHPTVKVVVPLVLLGIAAASWAYGLRAAPSAPLLVSRRRRRPLLTRSRRRRRDVPVSEPNIPARRLQRHANRGMGDERSNEGPDPERRHRNMLCVNRYPGDYVDECRSRVKRQPAAYRGLIAATSQTKDPKVNAAVESFEPVFFNNMVLVLDSYFCHRSRTIEGKDGNPLNEVRVLCNSMLENKGRVRQEKAITLKPEKSVLKLKVGDRIALREADSSLLSTAFFDELVRKFA